jgi:hypothetical protein
MGIFFLKKEKKRKRQQITYKCSRYIIIDRCVGPPLFATAFYRPMKFIKRLVRKASSLSISQQKKRIFSKRKKQKREKKMGNQVNDLFGPSYEKMI